MSKQDITLQEVFDFMVEHMATKEDVKQVEVRLTGVEDRLTKVEDRLSGVERDVSSLQSQFSQFEKDLDQVKRDLAALANRTIEDADVSAKEYLALERRVVHLERELDRLKQQAPA